MQKITAIGLVIALLLALCACGVVNTEAYGVADAQLRQAVMHLRKGEAEDFYALLYPGAADEKTFPEVFRQMREYCPISEDYLLNMEKVNVNSQIGVHCDTVTLEYKLSVKGAEYVILAEYRIDDTAQGFTSLQIVKSAGFDAAQGI